MNLGFTFYIFTVAVAVMAVLGIFIGIVRSSLLNSLSARIVVLVFASGPITLFLIPVANKLIVGAGARAALVVYVLIALCVPVALGLLAGRFVRRPLRHFNDTVTSLKQSNYKVRVRPTGISEFDEVFSEFNDLIHRLRHEEKLRKDLISDTSHELNTPLAAMIGQLTAMQEGKYAATEERIAMLKGQAERLTELVRQLDAYAKARMPDDSKPEAIRLHQFCEELIAHFSLELEEKRITVELQIADDYVVHASRGALWRILANLMQNALRYSHATEITIKANEKVITFADNGKGVPAESLPYLFERFYRVDKSRSRATGGLGLAIVKELAEGQGGSIAVRLGRPGLAFVLKLGGKDRIQKEIHGQ